jgi:hypothetical protein
LLFANKLDEFEDQLSTTFILYLAKVVPLKYCFTDWLVLKRPSIRTFKNNKNSKVLQTHSLKSEKFQKVSEQKKFILFLQFLAFAQSLSYCKERFGIQISMPVTYRFYRLVGFKVPYFFLFQNPSKKSINYFQVSQLEDFLSHLKEFSIESIVDSWTENEFQILTFIPMAKVSKNPRQQNCLIAEVYLAEDLFAYNYTYIFPDFFTSEKRFQKDAIRVGFHFIQTISSETVQKKFLIKKFLE